MTDDRRRQRLGLLVGFSAAALFGASTPFAKQLLGETTPELLAGLLYLGAFLALAPVRPFRARPREARLRRSDAPALAGIVVTGGILAPVLLLIGLDRVSGTSGSLMLNLEGPCTALLAIIVFGEHLGRRAVVGAATIFGGAAVLSLGGPGGSTDVLGLLAIAAACLLWAVDNNLTQALTVRDQTQLVAVKAGSAATVNIGIALLFGAAVPGTTTLAAALALGAVAYGASILLDAYALRILGAAREAAVFATAPFVGAILAIPILDENITAGTVTAALVMALGASLLLTERHDHVHVHKLLEHEHIHRHDEHHQHRHDLLTSPGEPHSHVHRHERLTHAHRHVSDIHHRHDHPSHRREDK